MKGIIYKIECNETGEVYYGSTTQSLNRRMIGHKSCCKQWKEGKCNFTTSFQIIDRGNYSYNLIEIVECEDKYQLETRERFYIENNECINKYIPCRTGKEYSEANKEVINEKAKEWYTANKDKKKAYREANKDHNNELQRQRRAKAKLLKKNI
jgi:hypothetical protein